MTGWKRYGKKTYPTLVAVNQYRVILLVMNDLKDGLHGLNRNGFLLGACHGNVAVSDTIGLHERLECLWEILVHQCANEEEIRSRLSHNLEQKQDLHDGFQAQLLDERIVCLLRIAAAIDTGNHGTKVGRLPQGVLTVHIVLGPCN